MFKFFSASGATELLDFSYLITKLNFSQRTYILIFDFFFLNERVIIEEQHIKKLEWSSFI